MELGLHFKINCEFVLPVASNTIGDYLYDENHGQLVFPAACNKNGTRSNFQNNCQLVIAVCSNKIDLGFYFEKYCYLAYLRKYAFYSNFE